VSDRPLPNPTLNRQAAKRFRRQRNRLARRLLDEAFAEYLRDLALRDNNQSKYKRAISSFFSSSITFSFPELYKFLHLHVPLHSDDFDLSEIRSTILDQDPNTIIPVFLPISPLFYKVPVFFFYNLFPLSWSLSAK